MKHKIQLVKEVNDKGEIWYFISKKDRYINGTMTMNFEQAVEYYNNVVNAQPIQQVIMETEIDY